MQDLLAAIGRMRRTVAASETLAGLKPIDRSSFEPAYIQLVNILSHAIARGDYRAGDQLPTEAELCAAFDVSPMTVRRAVGVLLDRGFVSTTRGRGTFVKPLHISAASFELSEFHDLLADPPSPRACSRRASCRPARAPPPTWVCPRARA